MLGAVACSGPARQEVGSDATVPANVPPSSTEADTAGFTGTMDPVERGSDASVVTTLAAVRTAPGAGRDFERVVFELDGASLPPYVVRYDTEPPTQCGSGQPVHVAGDATLTIQLHRTRAHAERDGAMTPTITDRDRRLEQPVMRQLTLVCDFEGEVTWVLGLAGRRPFRVLELASPARLAVDVGGAPPAR